MTQPSKTDDVRIALEWLYQAVSEGITDANYAAVTNAAQVLDAPASDTVAVSREGRANDMFLFLNTKKLVSEFNRWRAFKHNPKKATKRYGRYLPDTIPVKRDDAEAILGFMAPFVTAYSGNTAGATLEEVSSRLRSSMEGK